MKSYTKPEIIITSINNEDIITLSGVLTKNTSLTTGKFSTVEF